MRRSRSKNLRFSMVAIALGTLLGLAVLFSSDTIAQVPDFNRQSRSPDSISPSTGSGAVVRQTSPTLTTSARIQRSGVPSQYVDYTFDGDAYINRTTGAFLDIRENGVSQLKINTGGQVDIAGALTLGTDLAVAQGGTGASTVQGAAANLSTWFVVCKSAVAVSAAADTAENVLYTCTIPANAMGPNGSLRITTMFGVNNDADAKTVRVRFSGAAGTVYMSRSLASALSDYRITLIANRNATNSQVGPAVVSGATPIGASTSANVTSAVDTTAATTIVVTCQKADGTDTCTLDAIMVELSYGA